MCSRVFEGGREGEQVREGVRDGRCVLWAESLDCVFVVHGHEHPLPALPPHHRARRGGQVRWLDNEADGDDGDDDGVDDVTDDGGGGDDDGDGVDDVTDDGGGGDDDGDCAGRRFV
eukprot:2209792-Rhodomonas_salina.1